jgi:hypothetical protein
VAVRGDTSITWLDVGTGATGTPPPLTCVTTDPTTGQTQGPFATCDDAHRVTQALSNLGTSSMDAVRPEVPLPNEPYALAIDDTHGLLYVGHLTGDTSHALTGGFSLFDVSWVGNDLPAPRFIAPFPSPFPASSTGLFGVTALSRFEVDANGVPTTDPTQSVGQAIYASSRYVPAVQQLGSTASSLCSPSGDPGAARDIAAFPSGQGYNTGLVGTETRGIEFVGNRAFVLQRIPPALVPFEPLPPMAPALSPNIPGGMIETCSNPTFLYKHITESGTRLFVNCFDVGEVDVFDPISPHLVQTFSVGRGPAGLVFSPPDTSPAGAGTTVDLTTRAYGRHVAFVVGFGDNNISVVDLQPGSPTELHVIQRLGFPNTVPR